MAKTKEKSFYEVDPALKPAEIFKDFLSATGEDFQYSSYYAYLNDCENLHVEAWFSGSGWRSQFNGIEMWFRSANDGRKVRRAIAIKAGAIDITQFKTKLAELKQLYKQNLDILKAKNDEQEEYNSQREAVITQWKRIGYTLEDNRFRSGNCEVKFYLPQNRNSFSLEIEGLTPEQAHKLIQYANELLD